MNCLRNDFKRNDPTKFSTSIWVSNDELHTQCIENFKRTQRLMTYCLVTFQYLEMWCTGLRKLGHSYSGDHDILVAGPLLRQLVKGSENDPPTSWILVYFVLFQQWIWVLHRSKGRTLATSQIWGFGRCCVQGPLRSCHEPSLKVIV